jgi:hypothetical protein
MRHSLLYIFLLCQFGISAAQENGTSSGAWRFDHRLQAGWETDSNVYEALHAPESGEDLRLLYEFKAGYRKRAAATLLGYRGGGQFYPGLSRENKVIQEAEAGGQIPITPALQLGVKGYGRLKLFLRRDEDYAFGRTQIYLNTRLPAALTLKAGLTCEGLDYPETQFYNYTAPGGFAQLQRRFSSHLTLVLYSNLMALHYRRAAYRMIGQGQTMPEANSSQEDRFTGYGIRIEGSWSGFLGQIGYRREECKSNSFGYDFGRDVIEASFVRQIAGLYLRGLMTLQDKRYRDDLYPFWPLQLDTEREESNFLVLDLSRPVYDHIELLFRVAWYKNESPWANLYYDKRLLSVNLEYHR